MGPFGCMRTIPPRTHPQCLTSAPASVTARLRRWLHLLPLRLELHTSKRVAEMSGCMRLSGPVASKPPPRQEQLPRWQTADMHGRQAACCSPVHAPPEEAEAGQQGGQQHGGEADVEDGHGFIAEIVVVGLRQAGRKGSVMRTITSVGPPAAHTDARAYNGGWPVGN